MSYSRRQVSIGLVAAALVRCGGKPINPAPPDFPLGVASGDALPGGALVWTHYEGTEALKVVVWRADLDGSVLAVEQPVTPGDNGTALAEIAGLDAFTRYRFAFVAASGGRSDTGTFKTAPAAGTAPVLTLGAVSCTKISSRFDTLARAAERDDLDFFLMLGDTVYADECNTIAEYRERWAQYFSTPEYQALRAKVGMIATWDDHEFDNDFAGDQFDPTRFTNARQVFFEHMPVRHVGSRLWRSFKLGETAEVFALDCRSERSHADGLYLSAEQLDWLKAGLSASTARFKLVMTSVPISSFAVPFFAPFADDRWEGFPKSRESILQHVEDQQIQGVLWVAGDFHLALCGRVSMKGPGQRAREILVGPGANMPNVSPSYPDRPQFDWVTGVNNYTELRLDPAGNAVGVRWFDGRGVVIHEETLELPA